MISLLFTVCRIKKVSGVPILSFSLPLIAAFLLFIFGFSFISNLNGNKNLDINSYENPFYNNQLHKLEDSILYTEENIGNNISLLIQIIDTGEGQRFYFHQDGIILPEERQIKTGDSNKRIQIVPSNPHFSPVFSLPEQLETLFSGIESLNRGLSVLLETNYPFFLITALSIVLFCMSTSLIISKSRWPFFTFISAATVFYSVFFIYNVFTSEITREIGKVIDQKGFSGLFPALVFITVSIFLILIYFLFLMKKGSKNV